MISSENGNIWLSTLDNAVYEFDVETETFRNFNIKLKRNDSINLFRTTSIAEDIKGNIWLGTSADGIRIIDPKKDTNQSLLTYGHQDGITEEKIAHIITDRDKAIWISSSNGLFNFNYDAKTFYHYKQSNGIADSYLTNKGLFARNNGDIFIGQDHGFSYLNIDQLQKNAAEPTLILTSFKVFEEEKKLDKKINYLEKVTLNYAENFFTIAFSNINFDPTQETFFRYQLKGVDPNWIYPSDGRQSASYTDIQEGEYEFIVNARTTNSDWSKHPKAINIIIAAPWYRTYLFYLTLFMVTLSLIWALRNYDLSRVKAKNEANRLSELDKLKSELYTNITHEFRTPLTIIQGMSQRLQGDTEAKQIIKRNINSLLHLVNQLLDMSKLESRKMQVNWIQSDIVTYLQYLVSSFDSYADSQGVKLYFFSDLKSLTMDYDADKIQRVVANLISNAIKFTPNDGKVLFKITRAASQDQGAKDYLKITVEDNGIGIQEEHLPHLFERFYQVDHTHAFKGTGIGLSLTKELVELLRGTIRVESTWQEGSRFTILLPISQHAAVLQQESIQMELQSLENLSHHDVEEIETVAISTNEDSLPIIHIIEDNPDIIKYIKQCLDKVYQILVSMEGQSGIEKAFEYIPDLINKAINISFCRSNLR